MIKVYQNKPLGLLSIAILLLMTLLLPGRLNAADDFLHTKHTITTGFDGAHDVQAVDLDDDGDLDMLGTAYNANTVAWWENENGAGTFWTQHIIGTNFYGAQEVDTADIDGDGDLDVLGAAVNGDEIAWWENMVGDASVWSKHTITATFDEARSVAAADLDGDGDIDVLGTATNADDIVWWENSAGNGSGWILHELELNFDGAWSVTAGDLDGDGDQDVLGTATNADDVVWWENTTGDGSTWTKYTIDGNFNGARSATTGDMDGDGDLDVLGAAYDGDDVVWWENTVGNGSDWLIHTIESNFDGAFTAIAADVDDDGDLDILGAATNADDVTWWENVLGDGMIWSTHLVDGSFDGARSVAVGDVDGDGDTDLLAAAYDGDTIAWWEKTLAWRRHPVTVDFDGAFAVTTADIDGDGTQDVLGAAFNDDMITWWPNQTGTGVEGTAQTIAGDFDGPTDVSTADMDGDGDVDVLGASFYDGIIAWWENADGSGIAWQENVVAADFTGAFAITVADVDGDGDIDVLGAARQMDEVAWWENTKGDGSAWSKHIVATAFDGANAIAVADVDGDGDIDVLGAASLDNNLVWWENLTGNGSNWSAHLVNGSFYGITKVVATDLDKDGDADILAVSDSQDTIAWWKNQNGSGTLWQRYDVTNTLDGAVAVSAADVDGDGDMDILGAGQNSNDVIWWENVLGDGSYWFPEGVDLDFVGARAVKIVDMDGDGVVDFLGAASGSDSIIWWKQDRAAWRLRAITNDLQGATTAQAADLDGDGDLDILAAAYNAGLVGWRENLGGGILGFKHPVDLNFAGAQMVMTADVDGDGDLDVVGVSSALDMVTWWANEDGQGQSWTETLIDNTFDGAQAVAVRDMDGDGDLDILGAARWGDDVAWWENTTGDGSSWNMHLISDNFDGASSVQAADLDNDGDVDIVAAASMADTVAWWENAGDSLTWQKHTVATTFDGAQSVAVADLDGDGNTDIVGTARWDDTIIWWQNTTGDGMNWNAQTLISDYDGAYGVATADVDGDGDLDVLGTAFQADAIDWFENQNGDGSVWKERAIARGFDGARAVTSGDLDEDTDVDILGVAYNSNTVASWENTAPLPPGFTLSIAPSTLAICTPNNAVYNVATQAISGFTGNITLSTMGEPSGTTTMFTPNPVPENQTSVLTIDDTNNAASGHYEIEVIGTTFVLTRTAMASLDLYTTTPNTPTLLLPIDGAANQSRQPTFSWSAVDQGITYDLEIATSSDFTTTVYTATGLEGTMHTVPISLDTDTIYYWRVRSRNSCGAGSYSTVSRFTTEPIPGICPIGTTPMTVFSDDFETGAPGWNSSGSGNTWMLSDNRPFSGTIAYHASDVTFITDQLLVSPDVALPTTAEPLTLQFWDYQDIEDQVITGCYDGALLEISTDGGSSWTQLDAELVTNPYDGTILLNGSNPLQGHRAWCGHIQDWTLSVVDLDAYAGETVQLRFRLGTDINTGFEGWYIDELVVQACQ